MIGVLHALQIATLVGLIRPSWKGEGFGVVTSAMESSPVPRLFARCVRTGVGLSRLDLLEPCGALLNVGAIFSGVWVPTLRTILQPVGDVYSCPNKGKCQSETASGYEETCGNKGTCCGEDICINCSVSVLPLSPFLAVAI